jgi:hypothetical protein
MSDWAVLSRLFPQPSQNALLHRSQVLVRRTKQQNLGKNDKLAQTVRKATEAPQQTPLTSKMTQMKTSESSLKNR